MDRAVLGHLKTIFIPTPGQTEQEYLAGELNRRFGYCIVKQGEPLPIEKVQAGEPFVPRPESGRNMLQEAVADLLSNR
jgi:hypothetical protein